MWECPKCKVLQSNPKAHDEHVKACTVVPKEKPVNDEGTK